jgi:2-methylcitrate dehydratase PrpD
LHDPKVLDFGERVEMALDPEIDEAYPARWIGRVTIETRDGSQHHGRITAPKGDPLNPLSEKQIVDKAHKLALYGGRETMQNVENWISQIWSLEDISDLSGAFMR